LSAQWIVVGAGLTGATVAERIASVLGEQVLVVERRGHVAGNAHDAMDENGIRVHTYGPHIFHTNSDAVWNYLQRFGTWRPYEHRVVAEIDGKRVPVPFNINSIEALFPSQQAADLIAALVAEFGMEAKVPVLKLIERAGALGELGKYVYAKVFRDYTFKQWALLPEQLAASVTARVPIHISRDDRYFQDTYQATPVDGYTSVVECMLDHPKIEVRLNTDFLAMRDEIDGSRVIFTGPIDEYFDYSLGQLPYRSMRFDRHTVDAEWALPAGSVNFPDGSIPYTRITEMKWLTGQTTPRTTLVYEYPGAHVLGVTEPHYPVPTDDTRTLYAKYRDLAREEAGVFFCGRLGEYRYYNMDQAIAAALALFEKEIAPSVK
jgi:UDP-galactopyranose mutase